MGCQAPLSVGFFTQERWSGVPGPPGTRAWPRDGFRIALAGGLLLLSHQGTAPCYLPIPDFHPVRSGGRSECPIVNFLKKLNMKQLRDLFY